MSRHSIRHGGMLRCAGRTGEIGNEEPCRVRFHTYSILRLTRAQALAAGWGRATAWHVSGNREDGFQKVDCCPEHLAIAKMNAGRSKELIAADRAQRRAVREQKLADKAAAWAQKQADWAAMRAAKAAAKERRAQKKADSAALDATRAHARADKAKTRLEAKAARVAPVQATEPKEPKEPNARSPRKRGSKEGAAESRATRLADSKQFAEQAIAKTSTRQTTTPREES